MANPDRASHFPAIEKKHGKPMAYWFDRMKEVSDWKYAEQIAYLRESHGFSQTHANALVLYSRGSASAHRFDTVDDYFATCDETKRRTVLEVFAAITDAYPDLELVIAWNQPMLKVRGQYVFGVSVHAHHILMAPFSVEVLDQFRGRLASYTVNKKTIKVPVDWAVDATLLRDMAAARIAEIEQR